MGRITDGIQTELRVMCAIKFSFEQRENDDMSRIFNKGNEQP